MPRSMIVVCSSLLKSPMMIVSQLASATAAKAEERMGEAL